MVAFADHNVHLRLIVMISDASAFFEKVSITSKMLRFALILSWVFAIDVSANSAGADDLNDGEISPTSTGGI